MKPGSPWISWWVWTDGGLGSDEAEGMETNCWVWSGGAWERLEGAREAAAAELRKTKLGCGGGGGGASEYPT